MITRREHCARAFEQLSGRRASHTHGSTAAGTRVAAAEAAAPAEASTGEADEQPRRVRATSFFCDDCGLCHTFQKLSYCFLLVGMAVLGLSTKTFFACVAPKKENGLAALADPAPPRRASTPVTS